MKVIKQQSVKQKVSLQDNKIPMVLSYEHRYTQVSVLNTSCFSILGSITVNFYILQMPR